jgi:hypothetical protein
MKRMTMLVVAVALMVPASALAAGGPTCDAYNHQGCSVTTTPTLEGTTTSTTEGTAATTASTSEGTLPFTGLDVALLAVGGGGLLGAGLVVRRLSRRLN